MQDVALRRVESVLAEHVLQDLGAIDLNFPNAATLVIPEAEVGLECVALQDPSAEALLNGHLVRVFEAPPRPNHLGGSIGMPVVKARREAPRVVDGLVELERLRGLEASHRAEQRRLSRLVLTHKAGEVADLEFFAVLHGPIVLDPDFCELHYLSIPWLNACD